MKLPPPGRKVRVALQLCVSFGLLGVLLGRLDWERSAALVRGAAPGGLALLLAVYAANRVLMALKWEQLLRVLGGGLGVAGAVRVYYESSFVGFALPLGGLGPDIVRFVRLRACGIAPHLTLSSMVMERAIGLLASLLFVALALAALRALAPQQALRDFALLAGAGALVAAAAGAALLFHRGAGRAAASLLGTAALERRPRIAKYLRAARAYGARRGVLAANLGLALLEQCTPVLTWWIGSRALGTPLPLAVCLAVAPVTVLIQRLPVSYAGLGLREASGAALLVALGYDYSAALVLLMTLFLAFFVSLLPGAVLLLRGGPIVATMLPAEAAPAAAPGAAADAAAQPPPATPVAADRVLPPP
ncbi:MAG TPA: lysylphosphatidylglycerol synthase transmembrane domain-containing protein [Gammaproteobacteria bacterium]